MVPIVIHLSLLSLTAMHCRATHVCFMRPRPPNFFMSLQNGHSPHSVRVHAEHLRHLTRRRLMLLLLLDTAYPLRTDCDATIAGDTSTGFDDDDDDQSDAVLAGNSGTSPLLLRSIEFSMSELLS